MQEQDKAMFMDEMSGVTPMKNNLTNVSVNSISPTDSQLLRRKELEASESLLRLTLDVNQIKALEPEQIIGFKRDGVQSAVFDRLSCGGYKIANEVDIHPLKLALAREVLFQSIEQAIELGQRSILVIHGKGARSKPIAALMKSFTVAWLTQIDSVLAFHSAKPHHGGTGALYVMLTKSAQKRIETQEVNHKGANAR
ncbi:DNA endonuclease SmrA [Shewanella sp. 10N.286.54.B9]|uniref:DNA endonuclease SmrA n=1 Tax=Shewanella sp. 10N.286.54.B9 TaxID=3229719 RepID=UPI0035533930